MKKAILLALVLMFSVSMASAETVKQASEKTGNFWSREAERSGLKESTSGWGNFWTNLNPVNFFQTQKDSYEARKGGAAK